jgi:hypothetical protein
VEREKRLVRTLPHHLPAIWTRGALLFGALTWAGACGGGSAPAKGGLHLDGGPDTDGSSPTDGGAEDAPDLGSVVTGTQLLAGDLDIAGITTDDVAAVLDQTRGALAVPLSGAPAQPIDPASDRLGALGGVIFSFHNLDTVDGFGDLTVWTSANGAVSFVDGATYAVAVSDDGTRILGTGFTSSDATTSNLVLGGIDGKAPVTTLLPISLVSGCQPVLVFTGGLFVASHCAPGSTEVTISSIDPTSGAITDLLTAAEDGIRAVPGASGLVALIDSSGNAFLVPVAGGAPTPIGSNIDGLITAPDGSAVFLRSAGTVVRVPIAGGPAVVLAPTGVVAMSGVSPDGQQLLFQTVEGRRAGYGDLWLTSATASGPIAQLSKDINTTIFDSPFTADASEALYFTSADQHGVGTFTTAPVAGGPPTVYGQGGWTVFAYAGSRVVFTDQYAPVAKRPGHAVLRTLDFSTGGAPAVVATHAGAYFYVTQAKDRVAFSFNDGSPQAGLYLAPLP